ncbi:Uncharacterised protein [Mycobacteroides abscessus subsp. abscessus]|uniref:abortive infection family protein n=1 Tax=Mycobacteriaceae TaxID=1762 RepID=UPI00092B872C|nr:MULTISPECIES: abortive infection family protein [Mycobacteriaceae]SID30140.1 Uncharacterised protein [Mycobacteroides abscessus subsp. abscessus]SKQ48982.1 Uncharacterised protein [Mycobacteroides abscessus subsp. abscessus]
MVESSPDNLDLAQPKGIDHQAWAAIIGHRDRLKSAMGSADRSLVLGRAKELAECVGKVAISERGEVASSGMPFPQVVGTAHRLLKRQPGAELSHDPTLQSLVQSAMKIVKDVGAIRNSFGSGHGRQREPVVEQEMADIVVAATLLWVRWVLRRIEPLILGQPTALIRDLRDGLTFYRGDLTERLRASGLASLEPTVQQTIGSAVAERAMRGTFNVRIEGVDGCAASDSLTDWPLHYRRGLVGGLFFDETGNVHATAQAVESIAEIVANVPDQSAEIELLVNSLGTTVITTDDVDFNVALVDAFKTEERRLDPAAKALWQRIASMVVIF